jgi:signal transduction histidine kinase
MAQLALIDRSDRTAARPTAYWAHDLRNALATIGLHLDTLERLAGPSGHKAVKAAHSLVARATSMCEQALVAREPGSRRRGIDIVAVLRQVADLLAPVAPELFEIRIHAAGTFVIMADADETFRIVFNLLHNAVTVARRHSTIKTVDVAVERADKMVTIRIADDGPGLPATVRKHLFRPGQSSTGVNGVGLSIARALAEHNGGMLELAASAKGATFVLELPALATTAPQEGPVTRSLGRRAMER